MHGITLKMGLPWFDEHWYCDRQFCLGHVSCLIIFWNTMVFKSCKVLSSDSFLLEPTRPTTRVRALISVQKLPTLDVKYLSTFSDVWFQDNCTKGPKICTSGPSYYQFGMHPRNWYKYVQKNTAEICYFDVGFFKNFPSSPSSRKYKLCLWSSKLLHYKCSVV